MQLYLQFLFPMYLIKSNRLQNIFSRKFLSQDDSLVLMMLSMIISKCSKLFINYFLPEYVLCFPGNFHRSSCFTKIHICKATLNRKENDMHNSWKLEIRNCFIEFNTPFNLLLLVRLTTLLSKSKEATLAGSSKTLDYFLQSH